MEKLEIRHIAREDGVWEADEAHSNGLTYERFAAKAYSEGSYEPAPRTSWLRQLAHEHARERLAEQPFTSDADEVMFIREYVRAFCRSFVSYLRDQP